MTRVHQGTTIGELATILTGLGASMAVDLTGRRVLVTLTDATSASAASDDTVPGAIDLALARLAEAHSIQARLNVAAGSITPEQAARILSSPTPDAARFIGSIIALSKPVHPTAVRCSECGAFAAHELAYARELELRAERDGRPIERVDPAFVVRTDPSPGSYRVMMCNTLVDGPMRVVDGREYHEARCIAAERASAQMTNETAGAHG